MATNGKEPQSITDALKTLESQASNKADEFKKVLGKDYDHFKQAISDIRPFVDDLKNATYSSAAQTWESKVEAMRDTKQKGVQTVTDASKTVDEEVHKNPWVAMGVVGLFALFLGYLFGRKD